MTQSGNASHWVRWHEEYDDPEAPLSVRLGLVQAEVRQVLEQRPPGPIRVVSLCAGQGRDVIDVVAGHERGLHVRALLVEQDPGLVAFARARAAAAGIGGEIGGAVRVVEGDASSTELLVGSDCVPADLVLLCGIFGNISLPDIERTVAVLPSLCAPGASVIWTRHRRPPDQTPAIRALFAEGGFEEASFAAPHGFVLSVGRHRLVGPPMPFDPGVRLFSFVGDGAQPA
jgi:hypothetical protein